MKGDWKIYSLLLIGLVLVLFFFFLFERQFTFYGEISQLPTMDFPLKEEIKNPTTTLVFVGDVMLDRGVETVIEEHGGDYEFPFLKIEDYLKGADLLFGNLESVISDQGQQIKQTYPFRAEPEAREGLLKVGFDVLSVANNHALDYGRVALEDSIVELESLGINCVGGGTREKAYSPVVKQKNDLKIAYLAYTNLGSETWEAEEDRVGIAWLSEENLKRGIQEVRNKADLIIVSFHFGEEYEEEPGSAQKYFSHVAINYGADLVVGHHPHVVQKVERYRKGWIAYSLGNFVFDQAFSEETMESLILEVEVKEGRIKKVTPLRATINSDFQPELREST